MATSKFIVDKTTDQNGQQIQNLNFYGSLSENAELKWDPVHFAPLGRIMRATSSAMATIIREYYSQVFHDLRGVNLIYSPSNQIFVTEMYFSKNLAPLPEGKMENLQDLTKMPSGQHNFYYQRQILNNRVNGKRYTLNDETKLLLSDIMYGGKKPNRPNNKNWSKFIQEITVPAADITYNPRAVELLVKVSGCFDFNRIMNKMFGNDMLSDIDAYDDNGQTRARVVMAKAVYKARFVKYFPNDPSVFIFNIEQYNENLVKELAIKENPVRPLSNGIIYY